MDEKLKQLYDRLTQDGYELPEYSVFTQRMNNKPDAEKLYSTLASDGYELPATFDEFYTTIAPPPQPTQSDATLEDKTLATIGGFNRGVGQVISSPLKFIGAGGNYLQSVVTGEDVDPSSGMFTQAGQAVEDFFGEYNPRYENVDETLQSVAEGLGQGVGMMTTAGLGTTGRISQLSEMTVNAPTSLLGATGQAFGKLGKQAISPVGFVGGSMTAVPEWEAAKAAGLSDQDAFETLIKNYLVGQTEAIPVERLLVGLNRLTGGKILETVKLMGQQGLTEGVQEGIQTYLTNEIAKADYDPDRDPLFQVLESAKVGGIVGMILPGAMSIVQKASPEKRVKLERKLGELQVNETINEVGDTGDPQLNAEIDAEAQIDPVDKQVLEEVKVADAIQTEQKGVEADEKLQKELEEGTESTENTGNLKNNENTATNAAKEAEIPISQTPEYKEAVDKVTKLQEQFATLPIDENADQLLFDLREARQALQKIAGKAKDTRKKTPIQKQIEDATGVTKPEKSVKMTPAEAIKHQVQTFYRGADKGVKKGKELTNDLVSKVQEAIKEYPLSAKQTSQILTKVRKTNLYTPGSVSRLNSFIDKVSADAQYAEDLSTSEDLRDNVKKKSKTKVESIPQNYKSVAKDFAKIKPEDADNLFEYQAIATEIVGGFADPKSNKYAPINEQRVREYVSQANEKLLANEVGRVREEFGFGDEVTDEELRVLLNPNNDTDEFEANRTDARKKLTRDRALKTAQYSKIALNNVTSNENQSIIDNLKKAPLEQLGDGQLIEYVRVVDNIVENDDFSNTERIEAQIEAVNNANELLKRTKGKKGTIGVIKESVYNIPMMFNAIYSSTEKASLVRLYSGEAEVFNAGSRVEGKEHEFVEAFESEAKRINKKYGKSPLGAENQARRGVFGVLVRFPKGADPVETFTKSKEIVEESIARLMTKKDRVELAKDAQKAYDAFKGAKSIEEVFDIMKKRNPEDFEMWQFFNKKFDGEVKNPLKRTTEQIHNREFIEEENYTPKVFETVDKSLVDLEQADQWLQSAYHSDIPQPKQAKTSLAAVNALPVGMAVNFEFDNNMIRKYRESMYDIETSKARLLFREFMKLPQSVEILGGIDNKNKIKEAYLKAEEVQRGLGRDYSEISRVIDEITGTLRTLGYTAALGSADQFIKQYVPVATNTMWNLGSDSSLFFSHIPDGADKLFKMYTIGQRGRRMGGSERGDNTRHRIQARYRTPIFKLFSGMHKMSEKGAQVFMYSLTKGDVSVAQRSWVAYYLQHLKNNGVDITKVNMAEEHTLQNDKLRKEAAAYAEQKVKETQVVSNPAELAKLLRTEQGAKNWIKNIFIPFSTFSVNTKVRMIENIRQLRTNPNKMEAYRALAGTVTELTLYSSMKYYLLSSAYGFLKDWLEGLAGFEGEEEDEDDEAFKFKQWYSAIAKDMFPTAVGTMGENSTIWAFNKIAYFFDAEGDISYKEWKQENGETFYTYQNRDLFDLGLYSVGLERIQETIRDAQGFFTGETSISTNWGDKDVMLDDDQQKFLFFMTMIGIFSSFGLMDAGLYRTLDKIKTEQLKGGSSSGGSTQPRPRPRPRLAPRPRPARNMQ